MTNSVIEPIRILLVDDHAIVREGIAALLEGLSEVRVVGQASNGLEALQLAAQLKPDIVLMDIAMQGMDGLTATIQFRHDQPDVKVLILSMHCEPEYVQTILQAGARGYLTKDTASEDELLRALQTVYQGAVYIGSNASKQLFTDPVIPMGTSKQLLSERELEVVKLLVQGASNKRIGQQLTISDRTVETHRQNIHRKLGTRTTADLIKVALEKRWV